jgi:mediator of RNA polymerase II transcription subunit 14
MNQNGADGAAGVKDAQGRNGDSMVPPASTKPMTNGDRGVPQVDGPLESGGAFPLNGGKQIVAGHVGIPASLLELPPELVHITNYTPLSTLFSRVAQECFNDLTETLTKMADLPVTQQPGLTNGASGHTVNGAGNTTVNNTRKKQIMMEFAEQHRTRFVKLLVLSSWSRQSETVQRLVDVSNWQNQQTWHYFNVVDAMGNLKREMEHATLKSPDIETALHVLATGKTPWLSTVCIFFPVTPGLLTWF